MPKTNVEKLSPTRVKLSVDITIADLEPFLKQAYKTISEQVSIPGFRKGHVPAPIIDQRVGRQAVIEQAVNDSLDSFFQAALAETDTQPMGRPTADVEKWLDLKDAKSEMTLVFEVELLEIVKRDRAFGDDIGRRKMLAVFEMAAGEPDLVSEFRRRLSATLY